jgi:predicted unusual protein kinase regulating ubiquinone biosynthesis (AarF/ABC1/UbiB family)
MQALHAQTLAELQDRLQSFPSSIAMQLIQEELGQPVGAVYSQLSPEPVAAASLGQARCFLLCLCTHCPAFLPPAWPT